MGIITSKIDTTDNFDLIKEEIIIVNFIQIRKNQECNVSLEQLNMLLGLNVPKYSVLEGTCYPYLFCVNSIVDINKILKEYGYEIGYLTKQKVFKNKFNSDHRATCSYSGNDHYKLECI
jgi:hypothetical protein